MSQETLTLPAPALRRFVYDAFVAVGLAATDAETAADVLATADEFGVTTHGVKLLPGYLRRLQGGGARPHGRQHLIREGPAWALVDGDSALGVLSGVFGMQIAIAKAGCAGIAYVGVRNGGHFAAVGYYSLMAAKTGLIGISVANDTPSVIAPGRAKPSWAPTPSRMPFPPPGIRPSCSIWP